MQCVQARLASFPSFAGGARHCSTGNWAETPSLFYFGGCFSS